MIPASCVWGRFLCFEIAPGVHPLTDARALSLLEGPTLANNKSARKRIRVAERNRVQNRTYRSAARTLVKKAELAISAGDAEQANVAVGKAVSMLDRAYTKNVIHRNNAARRKSRLIAKYNAAFSAYRPRDPVKTTNRAPESPDSGARCCCLLLTFRPVCQRLIGAVRRCVESSRRVHPADPSARRS